MTTAEDFAAKIILGDENLDRLESAINDPAGTFTTSDESGNAVVSNLRARLAKIPQNVISSFSIYDDISTDTTLSYTGPDETLVAGGDVVAFGFLRYEVAASSASDHHYTTAGGVKLYETGPNFSTFTRLREWNDRRIANGGTVQEGLLLTTHNSAFRYEAGATDHPDLADFVVAEGLSPAAFDGEVDTWLEYCRDSSKRGVVVDAMTLDSQVEIAIDEDEHVSIIGQGENITAFSVNNADGGLKFGDATTRQFSVQLQDMAFKPTLPQSGSPFTVERLSGGLETDSNLIVSNVFVGEVVDGTTTNDFSNGVIARGLYRPFFHHFRLSSRNSSGAKWDAILDINETYKAELFGCFMNVSAGGGSTYGIKSIGTNEEGFNCVESTVNGADTGVHFVRDSAEPGFRWTKGHVNSKSKNFYLDGIKLGQVSGVLCYGNNANAGTFVDFELVNVDWMVFDRPQFRTADATDRRHFVLEPRVGGVVRNVTIILDQACLAADTGGLSPIYIDGNPTNGGGDVENITIYIPSAVASADGASYPDDLIELGPNVDPDEITIITDNGRVHIADGALSGPKMRLQRDSASPASGDRMGTVIYGGRNDAGEEVDYASVVAAISDETDGSEKGRLETFVIDGGSPLNAHEISPASVNDATTLSVAVRDAGSHSKTRVLVGPGGSDGGGGRALSLPLGPNGYEDLDWGGGALTLTDTLLSGSVLTAATWSAVLSDAETGGNVASVGETRAEYVQIGNLVFCTLVLTNIDTTGMTAANEIYVQGLPQPADNVNGPGGAVRTGRTAVTGPCMVVTSNNSSAIQIGMNNAVNMTFLEVQDLTSTIADIQANFFYVAK